MKEHPKIFIIIAFTFWIAGCGHPPELKTMATAFETGQTKNNAGEEARIVGSEENLWQARSSNIGKTGFLDSIQIFTKTDAFALGEDKNLHKTLDGGKTWVSVKPEIPDEGFISSLTFFDLSHGIMSVVKNPADNLDADNFSSAILETSDGGATWHKQFELNGAEIRKVLVEPRGTAWAVGRKMFKDREYIENRPVILLNNGSVWRETAGPEGLGSIENIFVTEDLTKIFIDTGGKIFTLNNETHWATLKGIENIKPQQIRISALGTTLDGKTFLFGVEGGREGIRTSIFSREENTDKWRHFQLKNVILRDAVVLSSNEIIASGSISENVEKKDTRSAVILHSFDGGKSWLVSYKTGKSNSFLKLWRKTVEEITAIGENGNIVHLRK